MLFNVTLAVGLKVICVPKEGKLLPSTVLMRCQPLSISALRSSITKSGEPGPTTAPGLSGALDTTPLIGLLSV